MKSIYSSEFRRNEGSLYESGSNEAKRHAKKSNIPGSFEKKKGRQCKWFFSHSIVQNNIEMSGK